MYIATDGDRAFLYTLHKRECRAQLDVNIPLAERSTLPEEPPEPMQCMPSAQIKLERLIPDIPHATYSIAESLHVVLR